ncbi:MAG: 50S ribosomal protein L27 [uncultured bacterium]|nr:MAG: 50S ribosomal protein L27 [uncultured bacterium]
MAHVKAGGSRASQHSQRAGKRLGVKIYGGEKVKNGMIIVRQRGAQFHAGIGTEVGKDFTLYSTADGIVNFKVKKGTQIIEVLPAVSNS